MKFNLRALVYLLVLSSSSAFGGDNIFREVGYSGSFPAELRHALILLADSPVKVSSPGVVLEREQSGRVTVASTSGVALVSCFTAPDPLEPREICEFHRSLSIYEVSRAVSPLVFLSLYRWSRSAENLMVSLRRSPYRDQVELRSPDTSIGPGAGINCLAAHTPGLENFSEGSCEFKIPTREDGPTVLADLKGILAKKPSLMEAVNAIAPAANFELRDSTVYRAGVLSDLDSGLYSFHFIVMRKDLVGVKAGDLHSAIVELVMFKYGDSNPTVYSLKIKPNNVVITRR